MQDWIRDDTVDTVRDMLDAVRNTLDTQLGTRLTRLTRLVTSFVTQLTRIVTWLVTLLTPLVTPLTQFVTRLIHLVTRLTRFVAGLMWWVIPMLSNTSFYTVLSGCLCFPNLLLHRMDLAKRLSSRCQNLDAEFQRAAAPGIAERHEPLDALRRIKELDKEREKDLQLCAKEVRELEATNRMKEARVFELQEEGRLILCATVATKS